MPRFEQRRSQLRRALRAEGVDALLVTHFPNVTYLTGFTGDDSYLLVRRDGDVMLSDRRYSQQLEEECPGLDLEIRPPGLRMIELTSTVLGRADVGTLGVESQSMTVAFRDQLESKLEGVLVRSTSGLVEQLREVKDKEEIQEIRDAIRYAERAFGVVRASLRPEQTERAVAYELESQIRQFGGTECSFRPIVAVGSRAALPHARASDRRIGESSFVLIDWGARGRLYVSDLTRVLVTGRIPPKLERIYGVVLDAQLAAIQKIRAGARMDEVDAAARNRISQAGFGAHFGHGLGHGIGLEIHESPRMAANEKRELRAGMVVTVEPGVYLTDLGGVRIEDDVLVTKDGCEVLTSVPKELSDCFVG